MPTAHWHLLSAPPINYLAILDEVDNAIETNADVAVEILSYGLRAFGLESNPRDKGMDWRDTATPAKMDKCISAIRQLRRDWSDEGADERRCSYRPVLQDLEDAFGHRSDKGAIKVLNPGAGLGRLVFEICKAGYHAEGNEIDYHMLITSNWVLNHTKKARQHKVYPFAYDFNNVASRSDQLASVRVPDVHPGQELDVSSHGHQVHAFERLNMTASDFLILYGNAAHKHAFDCVVTVFFIDTAPNFLRYLEVVRNCLKPGGRWINLGPLLWHWSDRRGPEIEDRDEGRRPHIQEGIEAPGSVDLSNEEVLQVLKATGFSIEKEEIMTEGSCYMHNPASMLRPHYFSAHWVARRK